MPKYQIKDNQSGKTVTISGDSPPTQADAEQIFQQAGLRNSGPSRDQQFDQGKFESMIDAGGHGVYDIPVLGGLLRGLSHPLLQGANIAAELGNVAGHELTQPDKSYYTQFMSPSQQKAAVGPDAGIIPSIESGASAGAGAGLTLEGGPLKSAIQQSGIGTMVGHPLVSALLNSAASNAPAGALYEAGQPNPTLGKIATGGATTAALGPVFDALTSGMLTKGGAARQAEKAVNQATKSGASDTLNDVSTEARQEVMDRYGDTPEVRQALGKVLRPTDPGQIEGVSTNLTPDDLLKWRKQILAREGGNLFKTMFTGSDLDQKIAGTVRSVISARLKDIAPGTTIPDSLYTMYSRLGGDVPKLALEVLGAGSLLGGGLALTKGFFNR